MIPRCPLRAFSRTTDRRISKRRTDPVVSPRRQLRYEGLEPRRMLHGGDLLFADAEAESSPMPDFSLMDVNPASGTFTQYVSPRDFSQGASAWYFGYAST